jgi:hypothetical protein
LLLFWPLIDMAFGGLSRLLWPAKV